MKKCSTCQQEKSFDSFGKHKRYSDGLQKQCKDCRVIVAHNHYVKNKKYYLDKAKKSDAEYDIWWKDYKKSLKCVYCGFNNPVALDFHHTEDNKDFTIANMIQRHYAKDRVLKEVAKCIVLCANCHRIEHSKLSEE